MRPSDVSRGVTAIVILLASHAAGAQIARTRSPSGPDVPPPAQAGAPHDSRFPFAGLWSGTRVMPEGSDEIQFRFTVTDGKYSGRTVHPNGNSSPQNNLAATAAGLTWEQPNSGGGTWVFHVHLAGPDSMVGTLVLRDAPANFNPVPKGTMVLTRQMASRSK
jgi:hypothetical protein